MSDHSKKFTQSSPLCSSMCQCVISNLFVNALTDKAEITHWRIDRQSGDDGGSFMRMIRHAAWTHPKLPQEYPWCILSAVNCPQLPALANGTRVGDVFEFNVVVRFSCFPGYELRGSHSTSCLSTQQWSDPLPNCIRKYIPHKHAIMCQYWACTGPMLTASDQFRPGTGN